MVDYIVQRRRIFLARGISVLHGARRHLLCWPGSGPESALHAPRQSREFLGGAMGDSNRCIEVLLSPPLYSANEHRFGSRTTLKSGVERPTS
jgi:hypothetical protein